MAPVIKKVVDLRIHGTQLRRPHQVARWTWSVLLFVSGSLGLIAAPRMSRATPPPTLYVSAHSLDPTQDGSAAHPYKTISAAVQAASSGMTVEVKGGFYNEAVVIGKVLTIRGAPGLTTSIHVGGNPMCDDLGPAMILFAFTGTAAVLWNASCRASEESKHAIYFIACP